MSNYNSLKATINANIKTNGNQEITGSVLNSVLNAMVNTLGAGYMYAGVAVPSTNPGTPDAKVFYIAATPGTYTNFGGLSVASGEVAILKWDSSWHKDVTGVVSYDALQGIQGQITRINGQLCGLEYETNPNCYIKYDDGSVQSSTSGLSATGYIEIGTSTEILYSRIKSSGNTYWGIAFYDASLNYISGQQAKLHQSAYGYEDTTISVPANAKYIRLSILPDSMATGFYVVGNGDQRLVNMEQSIALLDGVVREALSQTQKPAPIEVTWENGFYFDDRDRKLSNQNWSALTLDVEQYRLKTLSFVVRSQSGAGAYAYLEDEFGVVLWSVRLNGDPFSDSLPIPANAKTFKLSNRSASGEAVVSVSGYEYIDLVLEAVGQLNFDYLQGKKISIIGDSITEGTGASPSTNRYASVLCASLGAVENNLGVAGTCIADNTTNGMSNQRFVTRATQANLQGSDLIIVFGGTNDFSYDSKAIGDLFVEETITPSGRIGNKKKVAPSDVDTFAGALHELITTIRGIVPTTPMMFVTPLNRGRYTSGRPTSAECNVNGNYLVDFANAIKEICRFYSIPVLDLNACSELDFSNSAIAAAYSADSLHPNNKGHKVIADKMQKFIMEQIVPSLIQ